MFEVKYGICRVIMCDDTHELKKCQGRGKSKMDCEEAYSPSLKFLLLDIATW